MAREDRPRPFSAQANICSGNPPLAVALPDDMAHRRGRANPSRRQVKTMMLSSRDVAFRCALVHRRRKASVWIRSAGHLRHAFLGHFSIFAATNRRPRELLYHSCTRIYAASLCRARNSAARARPQRRQRQRRFAWSTFRLSGVSGWPLPQTPGMTMGSGTLSGEKDTT
jgi:hypothetical protein